MRNRRALRLRFVHPRKHLKHGLTVSCEEYWDAPEDFIDSTESSTILSSAPLDKGPKKLPDTLPPVLYPCAILGAPEIAPSGDMSDVAASRRPCLSATDHESKQVECDRAAPSILTKNNAAPVSEDDQSEIYSARSNVLGPRASLSSVFSSSTNTSLEPSLFDEDTAPESPNASIFAESPSKPETPIELQPEGKPALRWNFATIRRSPAPHDFKLPSNFSLSMSCARFKIKNAPQPKSLEDLPIRSQLYPGVKPCSCECDRDVSSLTAWIAKHNLRRQRKSKSKPEPTTAAAAQTQTAEDAAKSTKKKSARKFKVQLEEVVDVSISGTANTATSWTDVAGTPAPSSFDAFLAEDYGFPAPNLPRKSGSGPRTQPAKEEGKGPSFFDKGKWPAVDLNEARRELFSSGAPMMGRGSDATPMGRSFSQSEAPGPELAPNSPAVPRPPTPVIIPQDEIMTDVRQPTSLEEMTLEPGKPRRVAGRIAGRLAREARADREMS
ncbi:hypothetical protein FRC09_007365 [Ceratobasidium sp. 395]|nr:hypothetical protein FRC09_007365 [Ceratobasidium sp. 395]